MHCTKIPRRTVLAGLAMAPMFDAWAQSAYPSRPVTIVFPGAVGGPSDALTREIAAHLQAELGQPFVIEPRPGAAGVLGTQYVMKAAPDGYTLLIGHTTTMLTNPQVRKNVPFRGPQDFEPITGLILNDVVIVVPGSSKLRTLSDLIAELKAKGRTLNYGSVGEGSTGHLLVERLLALTGTEATHIPYRGMAQIQVALMAGELNFGLDAVQNASQQILAGKLRALAVASERRVPVLPDVPTTVELGLPQFTDATWYGLWAPLNTPKPIVNAVQKVVTGFLSRPEVDRRLSLQGMRPISGTPDDLRSFQQGEFKKWGDLIRQLNISVE